MPGKFKTCIVIGAGLSGLAAAYGLTKRGWHVTVIEAQQYSGGRVLTYRFKQAGDLTCELGGEWIGKDHKNMRALCEQFKLPLQKHQFAFSFWNGHVRSRVYLPGKMKFSPAAQRGFRSYGKKFEKLDIAQQKALDQFDWWSKLRSLGFTQDELVLRDLMDSTDSGESIRLTSAYTAGAEYFDGNDTDEMDFKIKGGNQLLPYAMVSRIDPKNVYYGRKVRAIHQRPDKVEVYVQGRKEPFRAEFCICTVPAQCLLRIKWDPELPEEQADAARQLQYSRIVKTAVLFNKPFWTAPKGYGFSAFTSRISDFCFESTYKQKKKTGAILCSYSVGDKADDVASEPSTAKVKDWIKEDMLGVFGHNGVGIQAIEAHRRAWQKVDWIGGAYAFYRPGQWFTVRPLLQRAHGRVLFAGEHLADEQGFMEGAVVTGQLAAEQI